MHCGIFSKTSFYCEDIWGRGSASVTLKSNKYSVGNKYGAIWSTAYDWLFAMPTLVVT